MTHNQEVVGLNPLRRYLDEMQLKLAIALKIKRNKGSQMGHTKNYLKVAVIAPLYFSADLLQPHP
jgi:hypothetical protein